MNRNQALAWELHRQRPMPVDVRERDVLDDATRAAHIREEMNEKKLPSPTASQQQTNSVESSATSSRTEASSPAEERVYQRLLRHSRIKAALAREDLPVN